MRATVLALTVAILGGASVAQAHDCRTYWVEVVCNEDGLDCRTHMAHTPGNGLESNPARSYWYVSAKQRSKHQHKLPVWHTEDTELCRSAELTRYPPPAEGGSEGNFNTRGGNSGAQ